MGWVLQCLSVYMNAQRLVTAYLREIPEPQAQKIVAQSPLTGVEMACIIYSYRFQLKIHHRIEYTL